MLYPIGVQDFENLRERGFAYVDKTDLVYELAMLDVLGTETEEKKQKCPEGLLWNL